MIGLRPGRGVNPKSWERERTTRADVEYNQCWGHPPCQNLGAGGDNWGGPQDPQTWEGDDTPKFGGGRGPKTHGAHLLHTGRGRTPILAPGAQAVSCPSRIWGKKLGDRGVRGGDKPPKEEGGALTPCPVHGSRRREVQRGVIDPPKMCHPPQNLPFLPTHGSLHPHIGGGGGRGLRLKLP